MYGYAPSGSLSFETIDRLEYSVGSANNRFFPKRWWSARTWAWNNRHAWRSPGRHSSLDKSATATSVWHSSGAPSSCRLSFLACHGRGAPSQLNSIIKPAQLPHRFSRLKPDTRFVQAAFSVLQHARVPSTQRITGS